MPTSATGRIRRATATVLGAVTVAGSIAAAGAVGAARPEPSVGTPSGLAVSYTAPPPTLTLTPYATLSVPANPDSPEAPIDVAILPDGGAVVVSNGLASTAVLVGRDGSTSGPIPLDASPSSIVATAGPVVYGLILADPAGTQFMMAAIALAGPNTGHVVAGTPVDRNTYIELPEGSFGIGPLGVLDRVREPGAVMTSHVDINGAPVTVGGLRNVLTISPENLVSDDATPARQWQLSIERHPETPDVFTGESPPAPGAGGTSVYWTSIGPATQPSVEYSAALQPVIAVLRPDGSGQWYSIPDGWSVVSSDVAGTLLARRVGRGDVVELARLDPSATGPAPAPIPTLAPQCDDYSFNNQYPLRRCDSGPAVRIIQQQLKGIDSELQDDGFFGPLTDRAVRRFQQANGLEVDGLVGQNTWRALTAGHVEGRDADGSGVIDPWELQQAAVPGFPPANTNLSQGGTTWGVVLAGSADFEDPALYAALEAASAAGYSTGPTDCDVGAAQAIGVDSEVVYTVSVYFANEADARAAQAAFAARGQPGVVAQVQTFCLD